MPQCKHWREIDKELTHNATAYMTASVQKQRAMERRALYFASATIHVSWYETMEMWRTLSSPALPSAVTFFNRRINLRPDAWPTLTKRDVKSHFARALLGFADAPAFDTHMQNAFPQYAGERLATRQTRNKFSTRWQWAFWLCRIAPKVFADPECVQRQHIAVLRWVRKGGMRHV